MAFFQVEAAFEGSSEFNSARVAALLILCVSASLSDAHVGTIPPVLFSYAVTLLGRIYSAFIDVMDRDALLAHLSDKSRSIGCSASNINHEEGEQQLPLAEDDSLYFAGNEVIGVVEMSLTRDVDSEIQSHFMKEPNDIFNSQVGKPVYDKVLNFANYILVKVPDIWPLIQSGFTTEVLRILRCWKEELATMTLDFLGSGDALAFTWQYLRIIKWLAKVWEHFLPEKQLCSRVMGELYFKLAKLDEKVKELRIQFVGFSAEEELNVLELMLVTCALRLCKVEICCRIRTLKIMTSIFSHVESLLKDSSTVPSSFVVELKKLFYGSGTSIDAVSRSPVEFQRCLKFFSLKQFVCHGIIKHVRAELNIPNNDSEHPLTFASGLPVGIECEITLHNITSENKLWLSMSMDGDALPQCVFLDLNLFEGSGDVRNSAFVAPFYRTPKASSFRLRMYIGLEYLFENIVPVQTYGGPRHELTFLCPVKEVYLSNVLKTKSHSLK